MGTYAIKMPDIGEGIAEVELVLWHVKPGDVVREDQVLAEVMTDKAAVEIPSPVAGTVSALNGEPGQLLAVGAVLIQLDVEGEGNQKAAATQSRGVHVAAAPAPAMPPPEPEPEPEPAPASPRRAAPAPMRASGEKPLASPAVRRRAWELGIELQFVHGSGPLGRITHEDLDVYLTSRGQRPAEGVPGLRERHGEQAVPVIGLRRKIAQKMQEAKRRIPHFSYVEEIDVTELEALRAQINTRHAGARGKLTLLPLLARAVVIAVEEFPQMNARFDDEAGVVTRFSPVHLGIATQTDGGLMVPVVTHAEALDLWGFANEVTRLAEAVRAGKATREELTGSTITISSLGPLGGLVTTPIINHPEVAIIGVNRIVVRPTYVGGAVMPRQLMNLSSSFDHRVIDGMDAARFIQAIRALLEQPAMLFLP